MIERYDLNMTSAAQQDKARFPLADDVTREIGDGLAPLNRIPSAPNSGRGAITKTFLR